MRRPCAQTAHLSTAGSDEMSGFADCNLRVRTCAVWFMTRLTRDFFARPADQLAPDLLGCFVVANSVTLRITEVEAYLGAADPGSHAYRGQTARNQTMFGPAGRLYVYRHMGLHSCCNVTAAEPGVGEAVLLRAGEIVSGLELARARRAERGVTKHDLDLAKGPGRLTVALGITWLDDGLDLCTARSKIYLTARHEAPSQVARGPRIGLRPEATEPPEFALRFWIAGDPTVSGPAKLNRAS